MQKHINPSLERDMLAADWFRQKVKDSDSYAQNVYAALCNNEFQKQEVWPVLTDETWGCSWRYAGGIIADLRGEGEYLDWYCSGMRGGDEPMVYELPLNKTGYVSEGTITDEIQQDLLRLGWIPVNTHNEE